MMESSKQLDLLRRRGRKAIGLQCPQPPFVPPPLTEEEERAKETLEAPMGEQPITPAEFEKRMTAIHCLYDRMDSHMRADGLMLALLGGLGYGKGAELFSTKEKWYS